MICRKKGERKIKEKGADILLGWTVGISHTLKGEGADILSGWAVGISHTLILVVCNHSPPRVEPAPAWCIPTTCIAAGLFTLRLQLKSLSFGNALLENLTALLAPHATPDHEWGGDFRGTVGRDVGGTGRSDVFGGSVGDGGRWRADRRERRASTGGASRRREPPGVNDGGDSGGLRRVPTSADTRPNGDDLAGLRLRLGTGTPKLRWALLEVLRSVIGNMYSITYSKSIDQPSNNANPACGQLDRENDFFPVPVRA